MGFFALLNKEPDRLTHAVQLFSDLVVPEATHKDSLCPKKVIALTVVGCCRGIAMARTVKLDRQFQRRAVKIQNVTAERMLPPEFMSSEAPVS